jgi:peptidoglycan/LPS O-acetylase OafA/YrhL
MNRLKNTQGEWANKISTNVKKSANLELLRFFLAFWVFTAHLLPWYTYGNSTISHNVQQLVNLHAKLVLYLQPSGVLHPAVIGFLVLSGYVIATGFNEVKLSTMRSKYIREWGTRRVFRIMPVYLLGLSIGWGVFAAIEGSSFKLLTGTNNISPACLASKALSISSIIPTGYPNCAFQGNAPLVTTAAEIGLYIIFIGTSILLAKGFNASIAISISLIWVLSNLMVATLLNSFDLLQWWTHASSFNYLLPWFLGAALAIKSKKSHLKFGRKLGASLLTSALITLMLLLLLNRSNPTDLFQRQIYLFIYSFVFYFLIRLLVKVRQVGAISNFLGGISYTLYAVHAPISIFMISYGLNLWTVVLANLFISAAIYKFFETPLRSYGRRIGQSAKN